MQTITITTQGDELETLAIELTSEEVSALYKLRKELSTKATELEKKLADVERSLGYSKNDCSAATGEIAQANILLTALGIQEKSNDAEEYYRKPLPISTRIALYIAAPK